MEKREGMSEDPDDLQLTPDAIRDYVASLPRAARARLLRKAHGWGEANADAVRYAPRRVAVSIGAVLAGAGVLVTSCLLGGTFGAGAFIIAIPAAMIMIGLGVRHARGQMLPLYLEATAADGRLTVCPGCSYDLRGSEAPRCPECGCPVCITTSTSTATSSPGAADEAAELAGLPSVPVGAASTSGQSKHTTYRRLVATSRGLRLVPSLYPVYLGLTLLAVYIAAAVLLHERIGVILEHVRSTAPIAFVLMVSVGGAAILISWIGPILAYPLALRFGTTVDFDVAAGQVRIVSAGAPRTIPLDDVRALQVCASALGTSHRRVTAYELNLAFDAGDGVLARACLLCGGPRSSIVSMAERIGATIGRPVITT